MNKFCKDCKYFSGSVSRKCTHIQSRMSFDPVLGEHRFDYASVLRMSHKPCTEEGKLWEKKPYLLDEIKQLLRIKK